MAEAVVNVTGGDSTLSGPEGGASPQKTSGSGGSNIYVRLYIRQTKSSTAGKVKLQVRIYFYAAPLSYTKSENAYLNVYLGTSYHGTHLLNEGWTWTRESPGFHAVYSPWYDLPEQNNIESMNIFATCKPTDSYPEVSYDLSLQAIRPSRLLTIETDGNVASYSYAIDDSSGVNGGKRINQTASTAIVYDTDKVTWTAIPIAGHKLDPASGTSTVSGSNLLISIITKVTATVHMFTSGAWHLYSIYIRRGGAWVQYQANIRKAGSWKQYS